MTCVTPHAPLKNLKSGSDRDSPKTDEDEDEDESSSGSEGGGRKRLRHTRRRRVSRVRISRRSSKSSKSSKSRNKSSRSKRKGGMVSYPCITKIKTEQDFIYYETINHYTTNTLTDLMPVIIEYDIDKSQFFIVDGNHRVAYHIIKKFKYIPVLIIFKNLFIDI